MFAIIEHEQFEIRTIALGQILPRTILSIYRAFSSIEFLSVMHIAATILTCASSNCSAYIYNRLAVHFNN